MADKTHSYRPGLRYRGTDGDGRARIGRSGQPVDALLWSLWHRGWREVRVLDAGLLVGEIAVDPATGARSTWMADESGDGGVA